MPTSVAFTRRVSSEAWIEVSYAHGRFWIRHDASVWDLLDRLQHGGFDVESPVNMRRRRT